MPYVKQERQIAVEPEEWGEVPQTAGELNYILTQYIVRYLDEKGKSYQAINDILGAIEGCKLEFYRRIVVPYENTKMAEHGDVY